MTVHERRDDCRKKKPSRLCRVWQIITREPKNPFGDPCVRFPGHIIRKPDPCIYSQFLLMQLNQPVTWDNPDVRILLNGAEQYSYNLTAGTEYTVEVTVHNSSRDKAANGTAVHLRWIEFGAGAQTRHPIATRSADVPIWPGTAVVTTKWRTPDAAGHYCIEVELVHPEDGNPANNRGWNNTEVRAASSRVRRSVRIFNQYPNGCPPIREGGGPYLRPERAFGGWGVLGALTGALVYKACPICPETWWTLGRVTLSVAIGYAALVALGLLSESVYVWIKRGRHDRSGKRQPRHVRTPCNLVEIDLDSYEFEDGQGKNFNPELAFRGKGSTWPATIEPPRFVFSDGEVYRDVELSVDAPDAPGPPGVFNVNVRQGGAPVGGVTIRIKRAGG